MLKQTSLQSSKISKVYVLGAKESGKTSIIDNLVYGFKPDYLLSRNHDSTIEDIYPALIVDEKGRKDKVHFFDTAGISVTKKFDSETLKNYVAYSDAIVMVYSIDNYDSFNVIVNLKKVIDKYKEKKEIPIICLGNKVDLYKERKVDLDTSLLWAQKENVKLFEVSAIERKTLIEPFLFLASKINHPQNKFSQLARKSKDFSNITMEL